MKIAIVTVAVIVAIAAIVMLIGASLPKRHSASRSLVVKHDRRAVYNVVRDVESAPRWRDGVRKVEILNDKSFREHSKMGVVTYEIVEDVPASKFITRIVDRDLGYSGSWTWVFDDAPGGTRVTITEDGEVTNVFFRFMSRFVFGQTSSIDAYLKSLDRRLG
jgi:hypothetical protein